MKPVKWRASAPRLHADDLPAGANASIDSRRNSHRRHQEHSEPENHREPLCEFRARTGRRPVHVEIANEAGPHAARCLGGSRHAGWDPCNFFHS